MLASLSFDKGGQGALLVFLLLLLLVIAVGFYFGLLSDDTPTRIENLLTGDFELDAVHLAKHRCRRELTVGEEHADETTGYEVKHILFGITQVLRNDACRNNGVVVGNL